MITFGKTSLKPNFLFGLLPNYFKRNDSGSKVVSGYEGEGLLERYMEIFCAEIDNEVSPFLDEVLNITDAEALSSLTRDNPTELLIHISELFGNPPDIGTGFAYSGDEDEYIVLIRYIKYIIQTKGTKQALIYFLAIYGYEIDTFTDSSVTLGTYDESSPILYDNAAEYDVEFTFFSGYDLIITDLTGTSMKNPTQAWLDDYLKSAIQQFITPLWATLGTLTYSIGQYSGYDNNTHSYSVNDGIIQQWSDGLTQVRRLIESSVLYLEINTGSGWQRIDPAITLHYSLIDIGVEGGCFVIREHNGSTWVDLQRSCKPAIPSDVWREGVRTLQYVIDIYDGAWENMASGPN